MIRGVRQENCNAFLLALEGWRRGLRLTWHHENDLEENKILINKNFEIGNTFSLQNGEKEHFFHDSRGDQVEFNYIKYTKIDFLELLKDKGIETVEYTLLQEQEIRGKLPNEILERGFPVNVTLEYNDNSTKDFSVESKEAIEKIEAAENVKRALVLHENKFEVYHVYIVDKKVVAAVKRFEVNGNEENLETGYIDVKERLSGEVEHIVNSVVEELDIPHFGIEIHVFNNQIKISNINLTDDIKKYIFPFDGTPRNVTQNIIDYYFPETLNKSLFRTQIYFDYKDVYKLLKNRVAGSLVIDDAPDGELYAKRYVLHGDVQNREYLRWLRRQVALKKLHGYMRSLSNGNVVVVIASHKKKRIDNFKNIFYSWSKSIRIDEIKEFDWKKQIKVGFEVRRKR